MKKKTNRKLALNKQKISELSTGNMGDVKGGEKPGTWGKFCVKDSFGWECWESELYTACHCERTFEFKGCGESVYICVATKGACGTGTKA